MSVEIEQYKLLKEEPPGPGRWVRLVVGALVVVIGLGAAYFGVKALANRLNLTLDETTTTIPAGVAVQVRIPPGTPAGEIAVILADAGVVDSATRFERLVRTRRVTDRLQAGTYDLETGMDPGAVVEALVAGPGLDDTVRLTVVEGLTVEETLASIERQLGLDPDEMAAVLLDGSVTSPLLPEDPTELHHWEGLLFPDTYGVREDAKPSEVLQTMADTMVSRVDSVDWSAIERDGFTRYEGLIIASMIEREAALDIDRPLIASVIYNRLDRRMLLQIDATVVYAIGEGRAPTLADLQIDSPYNTYRYFGLPPTPIAAPGLASLRAAAAPATTDYIFYVLIDPSGQHGFAENGEEFDELLQRAREQGLIP